MTNSLKIKLISCLIFSFLGEYFLYSQCQGGTQIGQVVTPEWGLGDNAGIEAPISKNNYIALNVIKGIQYEIDAHKTNLNICSGEHEIHVDNTSSSFFSPKTTFTAPFSGELKIYYRGVFSRIKIKVAGKRNTTDIPNIPPSEVNKWRIHFYGEQNNIAPESGRDVLFENYLGYRDENESFHFYSSHINITPISVLSNNFERLKVSNYFSTKAFMKTTRKGLYYVTMGADDGTRLSVDNQPVYNNWRTSHSTGYNPVENQIIKLTGNNTLNYEYFNKGVPFRYLFEINDHNKIIENTIIGDQTICQGEQASTITGDDFNRRQQQGYNMVFDFQWYYTKSLDDNKHTYIIGATSKDYTPDTQTTPFNQPGVYYLFRRASVRFKNIGMTEKRENILSNPVRIEVLKKLDVSIRPSSKKLCQGGSAEIRVVVNSGSGGTPPFTLSYKLNGVTLQVKSNENTFNIPINSNQTGTFKYEYESITDGKGCTTSIHKTDNITINPLPTATFLEKNTTLCLNTSKAQIPWVTFTGKPPFTVRVKATKTGETPKEKEFPLENNQNSLVIEHIPNDKGEFTYEILWVRDANSCTTYFTDKKKVINVVAPFIAPFQDVAWCLPEIVSAVYDNNGNTIIMENSYVLPLGDTALDVVVNSVPCCPNPTLKWTINNDLSNTRTGQPSTLGNISFENATSSDKTYTITYWLECNGQKYNHITRQVRITPRPNLEFQ
ncbi:hypothetical protein CGC48_07780 [Capnocytophaga cynodegmi]|uniref:Nucleoporin POM152 immunoglobulin-like domain-containing protein n=1 Tax=Capnocytophaga cynodegmi TaxID=28189 RepID=A0A250E6D9_9FLAO|nr:hypothetical protein [Capnocytophaga cynodegmi]ATA68540.1 hypothetical protein CGC48_07780 [Capnocytophaga cynodegmi]